MCICIYICKILYMYVCVCMHINVYSCKHTHAYIFRKILIIKLAQGHKVSFWQRWECNDYSFMSYYHL